jgi:hypothetical protein
MFFFLSIFKKKNNLSWTELSKTESLEWRFASLVYLHVQSHVQQIQGVWFLTS